MQVSATLTRVLGAPNPVAVTIIAVSSIAVVNTFKEGLCKYIEVTDLSKLHWMLGLEVKCDHMGGTIHLSQQSYVHSNGVYSTLQIYSFILLTKTTMKENNDTL